MPVCKKQVVGDRSATYNAHSGCESRMTEQRTTHGAAMHVDRQTGLHCVVLIVRVGLRAGDLPTACFYYTSKYAKPIYAADVLDSLNKMPCCRRENRAMPL